MRARQRKNSAPSCSSASLPPGLLNSYQVIELMPSEQMSEALKKSKQLIEGDTTVNN
jgi:hypothetical protein